MKLLLKNWHAFTSLNEEVIEQPEDLDTNEHLEDQLDILKGLAAQAGRHSNETTYYVENMTTEHLAQITPIAKGAKLGKLLGAGTQAIALLMDNGRVLRLSVNAYQGGERAHHMDMTARLFGQDRKTLSKHDLVVFSSGTYPLVSTAGKSTGRGGWAEVEKYIPLDVYFAGRKFSANADAYGGLNTLLRHVQTAAKKLVDAEDGDEFGTLANSARYHIGMARGSFRDKSFLDAEIVEYASLVAHIYREKGHRWINDMHAGNIGAAYGSTPDDPRFVQFDF